MKKIRKEIKTSIISIFIILILTGCKSTDKDYKYKLRIKESSWSGWTNNYKPKERTKEYDIVLGKEYSINSNSFIFTIKKVIKTTRPFSDNKDGINLNSKKTIFKISSSKTTKLKTPTTDAGEIYYLKLVK